MVLACGGAGECEAESPEDCVRDDACAWREPGCAAAELTIEEGCYPIAPCLADSCEEGLVCASKSYNPCADGTCDACGAQTNVCVPE